MRAHQVVVRAPCFDSLVCIVETDERKLVKIRFAQSAVEALDVRIFYRLTRTAAQLSSAALGVVITTRR
jgi:hypothetical protein